MRLVIVESPFAGNIALNLRYLRACLRDCLKRGEAPYASHGLYTQPGVLDDGVPEDRTVGIDAGFAWRDAADATVIYTDLGTTTGMRYGIDAANKLIARDLKTFGPHSSLIHKIEERTLGAGWETRAEEAERGFLSRWPVV